MPVVMGTAGHIDHGKTTLVKALTGVDCDRLAEEKKRGITIELGFASMSLPDGGVLGVVDVPGHERFVKNMVAGAAGIDFVTLVIAADEGVMPQTREHLEICTLLGITDGVVALTKTDLADPDWLALVTEDVRTSLASTFLADAALIPVSAHTGRGLDELKAELARLAAKPRPGRHSDLARLPVDRVFTMKGHGTVVTGTLISGRLTVGDEVVLAPGGRTAKARGLQVHGSAAREAVAGQRTAVNLQGLDVNQVERGDVLCHPGALFASTAWHMELTCLASSPRGIRHRGQVHFHHGSREVMARIYFWDRDRLEPGQTALCQARFDAPLAGVFGDRCVIRAFSPLRTVAGGTILSPLPARIKRGSEELTRLAGLTGAAPEDILETQLGLTGRAGATFARLMVLTGLESKELDRLLKDFSGKGRASCFDKETRTWIAGDVLQALVEEFTQRLAQFHKRHPMKQGVTRGELASAWGQGLAPKLLHFMLERLLRAGTVVQEQELLRLAGHRVSLASDAQALHGKVLEAYAAGGLAPPNMKDVLDALGVTPKEAAPVFKLLVDEGSLTRVKEDMYFSTKALTDLKARVTDYFASHAELGPVEFRELTGLTRKHLIPLLEYLDKEKITVRVGDKRLPRAR